MSTLDRPSIVAAALEVGDRGGLSSVTVRGVADRLRVTPMALYRHVGGKEDLLDQVTDELYAEFAVPTRAGDWWQTLARIADAVRSTLLAHPWALPLFSRPAAGPHAAAAGRSVIQALRDAGFSERETNELHEQLTHMVLALVATELHGRRNRAAFDRGLGLLRAGLEARRPHPGRPSRSAAERGTKGG
jgi:AcrR family transcriptional regulator